MSSQEKKSKILIVDDVPANVRLLAEFLGENYDLCVATNGAEALEAAAAEQPDLILLDVVMPDMDGYTVCQTLKVNEATQKIPIVFVTANTNSEHVVRGLEVGALYYLTKPIDIAVLGAIVKSVLSKTIEAADIPSDAFIFASGLRFMEEGQFRIKTWDDACNMACFLARISPEPHKTVLGLRELLLNSVEHGSLGITYEEKSRLLGTDGWDAELVRRSVLPEYKDKSVVVRFQRTEQEIRFLIKDEGPGFQWQKYLKFDPKRAFDFNGRGVLMSSGCFDQLHYLGVGNEVLAVVALPESSLS